MKKNEIINILKKLQYNYCKLGFDLLKDKKYNQDKQVLYYMYKATSEIQEATNKIVELVK